MLRKALAPHGRWLRFVLCLWAASVPNAGEAFGWTNELLASFPLAGNPSDHFRRAEDMELIRTRFEGDALFMNGEYEHGGTAGFRAIAALPGLSYQSLTFGLHFFPLDFEPEKSPGRVESVLQRVGGVFGWVPNFGHSGHQVIVMGGTDYRWLGYRQVADAFELTLNNQRFVHRFANVTVSVGQWHSLVCTLDLKARRVVTLLDGQRLPDVILPADFSLEVIGSEKDVEDREIAFTNYSNGEAFHGYAARLRVAARALDGADLDAFASALAREAPVFRPGAGGRRWSFALGFCLLLGAAYLCSIRLRSRPRDSA